VGALWLLGCLLYLFVMGLFVVPSKCPVCGRGLRRVDATARANGLYFVWCPNWRCRWCLLFENAVALLDGVLYCIVNCKVVSVVVDLKQIGAVVLVKKRDLPADTAFGIKVCQCRADGSPDFGKEATLIYMDALKALIAGDVRYVSAWLSPAYVKPVEAPK
jgi:hypothetical protein